MVVIGGRAAVRALGGGQSFARPSGHSAGDDVPPVTGDLGPRFRPGPAPDGQVQAGQLGSNDGYLGTDPGRPYVTAPVFLPGDAPAGMDSGTVNWPPSFDRFGLQGFNDKLTVKDRHAFWDTGSKRTGVTPSVPGTPPNPITDGPTRPDLRALNRTLSYQAGSDASRNQDDLARPYTWLGEQGSGWAPVYGGVPGLYQPYGTRGGVPYPIVDPSDDQGGPVKVWSGPPHGLHSLTYPDRGDTLQRYTNAPQMVPGRYDRPSNSPQAGQSYSQTVQFQGMASGGAGNPGGAAVPGMPGRMPTRGTAWEA